MSMAEKLKSGTFLVTAPEALRSAPKPGSLTLSVNGFPVLRRQVQKGEVLSLLPPGPQPPGVQVWATFSVTSR